MGMDRLSPAGAVLEPMVLEGFVSGKSVSALAKEHQVAVMTIERLIRRALRFQTKG